MHPITNAIKPRQIKKTITYMLHKCLAQQHSCDDRMVSAKEWETLSNSNYLVHFKVLCTDQNVFLSTLYQSSWTSSHNSKKPLHQTSLIYL